MKPARSGETFLCLSCGRTYEAASEESRQNEEKPSHCPGCGSTHALNLGRNPGGEQGCGTDRPGFITTYG